MNDDMNDAPEPTPCQDRPRACKRPKIYLVESGNFGGGHSIGPRSCALHLADTVEYAGRCAQPVRVLNVTTATDEQRQAFREARGGPWAARVQAERAAADLVSS